MKILIYGMANCAGCKQAKTFCEKENLPYEYKEIVDEHDLMEMQRKAGSPLRTVPQIFSMNDGFAEHIGGLKELIDKFN